MLQLKNNTPFQADFQVFPNRDGIESLYLIVKATFNIGENLTLSAQQLPIFFADEYFGEPAASSIKRAAESHIEKATTDILLYGLACSKDLKPTRRVDISLQVGSIIKAASVYGNRTWQQGRATEPEPFVNMPLVWERAYGGVLIDGTTERICEENPVGIGFDRRQQDGVTIANIEPLVGFSAAVPRAIGFGPLAPSWPGRSRYAGTYDELWQSQRAPYLPSDFDARFLNVAPADQQYPNFMCGGERVQLVGMHPEGTLEFNVPKVNLAGRAVISNHEREAEFQLETLALYPNQKQFSLTWRAALTCPRGAITVQQIMVSLRR